MLVYSYCFVVRGYGPAFIDFDCSLANVWSLNVAQSCIYLIMSGVVYIFLSERYFCTKWMGSIIFSGFKNHFYN